MLRIPKIFHHIWLGKAELPSHFKQWLRGWAEYNPGWTVMQWTDSQLPDIINREAFVNADKMAKKSDILRYEVCATYGGVYIDADFEPLRPIEPILSDVECFIADERDDVPCNAILGCIPNHPFMEQLVRHIPESIAQGGDIVDQTGPRFLKREIDLFMGGAYSKKADPIPPIGDNRYVYTSPYQHQSIHSFTWPIFYPYYYTEPEKEHDIFPDAYGKHHWTASWWKHGGV